MAKALFSQGELAYFAQTRRQDAVDEINKLTSDYLLAVNIEDLQQHIFEKYSLVVPELDTKSISKSLQPTPAPNFGTNYIFEVPFRGDHLLFQYRPTRFYNGDIHGEIDAHRNILKIRVFRKSVGHSLSSRHEREASSIDEALRNSLGVINSMLTYIKNDLDRYHPNLKQAIYNQIILRRQHFENEREIFHKLPYALQERTDTPEIIAAPVQKKLLPKPLITKEQSEFYLEMEHYEHILKVVNNMSWVMERSPGAFDKIKEEDLRWHFVFQLNGHYEGQATGETFNAIGKTDILIRVNNHNIFIAECKFWKGKNSLVKTIDQILGYVTWRDTKAAILLFVRQKVFSSVLEQIPDIMGRHPQFEADLGMQGETQFRFKFSHQDDPKRELLLTVLAFHVPKTAAIE